MADSKRHRLGHTMQDSFGESTGSGLSLFTLHTLHNERPAPTGVLVGLA
jgi:hypothetical protein